MNRERNTHRLVGRLNHMAEQLGGSRPPAELILDAACEIERLRRYAELLETIAVTGSFGTNVARIEKAREQTFVNWQAIYGANQ